MLPSDALTFLVSVLSLLLSQEAAGGRCRPYKGDIGFTIQNAAPCEAQKLKENVYIFTSPGYPDNYTDKIRCDAEISTEGPRYLVFRPMQFDLLEKDHVTLRFPYKEVRRLSSADKRTNIFSPSSRAAIRFRTSAKNNDKGFKIKIRARKLNCHQVCDLSSGDSGFLEMQNYGANTFCEWWMSAPKGCKIQLEFLNFNVGDSAEPASQLCPGDYVAVSRRGKKTYSDSQTESFCGASLPGDSTSVGNKVNVLFNGEDGGEGFNIKYTVVCEASTTTTSSSTTSTSSDSTTTSPTSTPPTTAGSTTTTSTSTTSTSDSSTTMSVSTPSSNSTITSPPTNSSTNTSSATL